MALLVLTGLSMFSAALFWIGLTPVPQPIVFNTINGKLRSPLEFVSSGGEFERLAAQFYLTGNDTLFKVSNCVYDQLSEAEARQLNAGDSVIIRFYRSGLSEFYVVGIAAHNTAVLDTSDISDCDPDRWGGKMSLAMMGCIGLICLIEGIRGYRDNTPLWSRKAYDYPEITGGDKS